MRINDDEDHCGAEMLMNLLGTCVCAGNMSTSMAPVLASGDKIRVFGKLKLEL